MTQRTSFTRTVESILLQTLTGAKQILSASNSYLQQLVATTRQLSVDAANSATASQNSANDSAASASASAASASNAKDSQTRVTALYLSFSRQWYGELNSDPDVDPINGGPPLVGAQYYNLTTKIIRQYTVDGWQDYDLDAQHQSQNAAMSASQSAASAAVSTNQANIATAMAQQTTNDRNLIQTIMGPIVVPNASYALRYTRVNSAGTAYETRTPGQVLTDIGGASQIYADQLNNDKLNRNGDDTKNGLLNLNGTLQFGAGNNLTLCDAQNKYRTNEYLDSGNSTRVIDINAVGGGNLGWFRFPSSGRAYSNAGTFSLTSETDLKYDKVGGRIAPSGGGFFDFLGGGYSNIYRNDGNAGDGLMDFHSDVNGTNNWVATITCDGSFKIFGGGMFVGTATSSEYGDLAEKYTTARRFPKGTIMSLTKSGAKSEATAGKAGSSVLGVISTKPGLMINEQLKSGQFIGIIGRVPTRVVGVVKRGDPISASGTAGVGVVGTDHFIGYAVEDSDDLNEKLIEVSLIPGRSA